MPELPEVRAHAERLTEAFGGATLLDAHPLSFQALKTFHPTPDDAAGATLGRVRQRGKLLLLEMATEPTITFVVHLMQGGRLRPDEKQSPKPKGGLMRWRFTDGRALLLTEAGTDHKAGVWVRAGDAEADEPLVELGPDADAVDVAGLGTILHARPAGRLHGFLRDQHGVAGLGRRLANEVCWRAEVSPFAATRKLDGAQVAAIHAAIVDAVEEGLTYERTRSDMSASKDRPGSMHHRTGEECPVCGDVVRAVEYSTYTVQYCATCQTGGKVLADNTTSKFLR